MPQQKGFGPVINHLTALLESKRRVQADEQAAEDKKVEDQRAAELHKILVTDGQIKIRKIEANLALDKAKLAELHEKIRLGRVEEAQELMERAATEERAAATGADPLVPSETGEGQVSLGEFGGRTPVSIEDQFIAEENRQRGLEQLEDESIAKGAGSAEAAIARGKQNRKTEEVKAAFKAEEKRQAHINALEIIELKNANSIRESKEHLLGMQIPEALSTQVSNFVGKIEQLKMPMTRAAIPDKTTFDWVASELARKSIVPFSKFKEHELYVSQSGNMIGILEDTDAVLRAKYGITQEELEDVTARVGTPQALADPGFFARIEAGLTGFAELGTGGTNASVLEKQLEAKLATLSNNLGGDTGSRLSDLDLKLARTYLVGVKFVLFDNLQKRKRMMGLFEDNFNNFYASVSPERRAALAESMQMPWSDKLQAGLGQVPQVQQPFAPQQPFGPQQDPSAAKSRAAIQELANRHQVSFEEMQVMLDEERAAQGR